MENSGIANVFRDIASLLELKEEDRFRIRSYQKIASIIENHPERLEDVLLSGGIKALMDIEGIGEHSALKIEELVKTEKLKYLDSLLKEFPRGLLDLLKVRGVGPKLVSVAYKKLKINNTRELLAAAKSGKLRKLPGIRDKKIQNIIKEIEGFKARDSKHYIGDVLPYAETIVSELKRSGYADKVLVCGSLRRMKEAVGDIDILVTSPYPEKATVFFSKLKQVKRIAATGPTKTSVILENGMDADLRVVEDGSFGSASHYFTGSKQHNIKIRTIAIKKGLKVSEYGVFKGKKKVAGKTEEEVFKALGIPYIPPEIREDSGEFEAAARKKLPRLVELSDIKGDLHVHSDYSDGDNTIAEIARHAQRIGYEYVAITDHSKSTRIAGGLTEKELLKQIREIDALNRSMKGFRILKGTEVDILPDGSLDFSDELLAQLDIVIASVHSRFNMPKAEMTARIIEAVKNRHVAVIGHPTGRLLGKRDPYEVDLEKLIDAAAKYGKALELNSHPKRLDLNDIHCRLAKEKGVKIALGTDSHDINEMQNMRFGIGTARRGWIEKSDLFVP